MLGGRKHEKNIDRSDSKLAPLFLCRHKPPSHGYSFRGPYGKRCNYTGGVADQLRKDMDERNKEIKSMIEKTLEEKSK
jgi:hypothetical protein